jgi:hypothetical protein
MATVPTSSAGPLIFTQGEATAAQRTWMFHLTKAADGTDCTGVVPVMTISKAGAAFAAVDAGTAITELTNGWYKVVHAAADLDTLGALGVRVAVATADTLNIVHQVTLFDLNVATAGPVDGGLTLAKFDAAAQAALQTPLSTRTTPKTLVAAAGDVPISMKDAVDCAITVTGTWGGATMQPQTCEDPTAGVPVWTNSGAALVATDGTKTIAGPHNAVRAHVTGGDGTTNLAIVFAQRKPSVL